MLTAQWSSYIILSYLTRHITAIIWMKANSANINPFVGLHGKCYKLTVMRDNAPNLLNTELFDIQWHGVLCVDQFCLIDIDSAQISLKSATSAYASSILVGLLIGFCY